MHTESHPQARQTVAIKEDSRQSLDGAEEFWIEDWWDVVTGTSWMHAGFLPAAVIYATRSARQNLPLDNEVLYGKIDSFGYLVHVSELQLD